MAGIRVALPDHAITVLAFGAKHGYSEVYTKAAPHTLEVGPAKAFQYLGHVCFVNWVSCMLTMRRPVCDQEWDLGIIGPVP